MCTAMLTSWEGTARNLSERVPLAVTARSPIERLLYFKKERGWKNLQLYSDTTGGYTRTYVSDDGDVPALTIFTRSKGTVRHFWSGEMSGEMADPGQNPRGARTSTPCACERFLISHLQAEERPGTQNLNTPACQRSSNRRVLFSRKRHAEGCLSLLDVPSLAAHFEFKGMMPS
jgi:hypothetical protein